MGPAAVMRSAMRLREEKRRRRQKEQPPAPPRPQVVQVQVTRPWVLWRETVLGLQSSWAPQAAGASREQCEEQKTTVVSRHAIVDSTAELVVVKAADSITLIAKNPEPGDPSVVRMSLASFPDSIDPWGPKR